MAVGVGVGVGVGVVVAVGVGVAVAVGVGVAVAVGVGVGVAVVVGVALMEMPIPFKSLTEDYMSFFHPEDGDIYPYNLTALNFLEDAMEALERIRLLEYSPLKENEYELLKRFREWR